MRPRLFLETTARRSAEISAAGAGAVAIVAIVCWACGAWGLAAWAGDSVPMAPLTAWTIVVLSGAVVLHGLWPARRFALGLAHLAVFSVAAVGLAAWAWRLAGVELPLERWLAPVDDHVRGFPVGRMSPLTATALLVASAALWLELPPLGRRGDCRQAAALLALADLAIGLIVLLTYAAGAPLLYGSSSIPMAVPTAVSFVLIGLAVMAAAGPDTVPLALVRPARSGSGPSPSRGYARVLALGFLSLVVAIGWAGYSYFAHQLTVSRQRVEDELCAIANLKVEQIVDWRDERTGDAQALMQDPFASAQVRRFLADPSDAGLRPAMVAWLRSIREHNQCLRVVLLDPRIQVRLAFPEDRTYFGPVAEASAADALRTGEPAFSDLHRSRFTGEPHLDLAVPLGLPGAGPAGLLVMEVNPEQFLYPRLREWPASSQTAETLLVHREGDEVVYLNDLRHQAGAALALRLPVEPHSDLPAARAAMGEEGVVEGRDYRGVPALAAIRRVPGSPWYAVAKVDQEEVFAPLRERAWSTAALLVGIVLLAALGVAVLWRQHDNQWLRKQLDVELEKQLILDSAEEGILGLDVAGRLVFVNPAACRMLGYARDELVGVPGHFAWHGRRANGDFNAQEECVACAAMLEGKGRHSDQEVFWRKDGTSFPVEYTATPAVEHGKRVATVVTFRDITEHKRAGEALRESEKRFMDVLYASNDAILLIRDNTFVDCNEATARMLGYATRNEFLMTHPSELSPPEQPDGRGSIEKADEMMRLAFERGFHRFEWMHCRANGESFPVEVSLTPIVHEGKHLLHCVWRDITEHKRAGERLHAERAKLDAIFDSSPVGMVVLNEHTEVVRSNRSAAELLEKSMATLLGRRPGAALGCVHASEDPRGCGASARCAHCALRNCVQRVMECQKPAHGVEAPVDVVRNGTPCHVWLRIGVQPVLLEGSWHAVVAFDDVTIEKQYAVALESANKALEQFNHLAESAARAKSEFLANMSHEIRTPMTAILGYADLLLDECSEPAAIDRLRTIKRNGEHLLQLLNDILDLSKCEAGKLTVEQTACSPRALVADVYDLLLVRADAKGIALRIEIADGVPDAILTDPTRLRQVLVNLAGNAIKFTEEGEVRLAVEAVPGQRPIVQFDVIDTGIGMSPEQAAAVFLPFSQADSTTTRKFGGTGLGLAISQRLAEALGGTLTLVASQPGAGSRFRLSLPGVAVEPPPPASGADEEAAALAGPDPTPGPDARPLDGCRVLLAEDGPDNQRLIAYLLKKAGAMVTVAENGQLAVKAALAAQEDATPFDIVLMDMQMPVMDGYEATRELRRQGYTGPVIALTAHAMAEDRQRCLDAGCSDYLSKPIGQRALLDAIEAHLAAECALASR